MFLKIVTLAEGVSVGLFLAVCIFNVVFVYMPHTETYIRTLMARTPFGTMKIYTRQG